MANPVVEKCREVRQKLVKELGGIDGLFDELERLDRKRLTAESAKKKRTGRATARKKTSTSKRPKAN